MCRMGGGLPCLRMGCPEMALPYMQLLTQIACVKVEGRRSGSAQGRWTCQHGTIDKQLGEVEMAEAMLAPEATHKADRSIVEGRLCGSL